ncbi:hypothetical protein Val02_08210 [Virgisporangium aliadipatigenens]|uniref:Uncharacterized protein n=1 Tax=Virgisporangium aliadipatigenens TaxID=741659 RepID=A0A8J3YH70_9ACTN|nr:hypothetical protein Val02_08210 [Virgisporangium aliadipatigenens]
MRGDGPFAAVGRPVAVQVSPDGTLVAVGGAPSAPRWHGFDVGERPEPHRGWYPIGVYRTADLSCAHLVTSSWEPSSIAFHPTLPLVAVGTGTYDGGWRSDGELLLLDVRTGDVVSVLDELRWVHRVAWRPDGETLDLILSTRNDGEAEREGAARFTVAVRRSDWRRAQPGMVRVGALCRRPEPAAPVPSGNAEAGDAALIVDGLCTSRGTHRVGRGAVWALRALPDGRVLAALAGLSADGPGVRAECWSAGPSPDWSVPVIGAGCQLAVAGSSVVTVPGAVDDAAALYGAGADGSAGGAAAALFGGGAPSARGAADPAGEAGAAVVSLLDVGTGLPRAELPSDGAAVLVSRSDGWFVLRGRSGSVLYRPDGTAVSTVDLRGPGLYFDVRHSPELLCVDEVDGQRCVVAVDVPDGSVRPVFPLDWGTERDGVPGGGPAVFLTDAGGPAVVQAGAVHCGFALRTGCVFVVRRAYPSGTVSWVHRADHPVTAVESDGRRVFVAFNNGDVAVLDAVTGRLHRRREVEAGGLSRIPLSLALTAVGGLVIGTLDGLLVEWRDVD